MELPLVLLTSQLPAVTTKKRNRTEIPGTMSSADLADVGNPVDTLFITAES